MPARQVPQIAVATLGRLKGFLVVREGERARWITIDRSDLVGADRRLFVVSDTMGRRQVGAHGSGARKAARAYEGIHGRSVEDTRTVRYRGIPRSARLLGEAAAVIYQPIDRDGKPRRPNRHSFKTPRPQVWATGSALYLFGGRYRITRFGIVG